MSRRREVSISTPAEDVQPCNCKTDVQPGAQPDASPSSSRTSSPEPIPVPEIGGRLSLAFRSAVDGMPVPPTFYPGQKIPILISFTLPTGTYLPLAGQPRLTLSLVGTLTHEGEEILVTNVPASLSEDVARWVRQRNARTSGALPEGRYILAGTFQVPLDRYLPPTFAVRGSTFSLTYSLHADMTCDVPSGPGRKPRRVVVAYGCLPFELLPASLPTPPPQILPHNFWIPTAAGGATERWAFSASLPTQSYSPTSVIPLDLWLRPQRPTDEEAESRRKAEREAPQPHAAMVVRVSLVREERTPDSVEHTLLLARVGWVPIPSEDPLSLRICLPLITDNGWTHGYTTYLDDAEVSADFALHIDVTFLRLPFSRALLERSDPGFSPVLHGGEARRLWSHVRSPAVRTIAVPLVIGSVGEPAGALRAFRWQELRVAGEGEIPAVVEGEDFSAEDGWILPPPSYECAVQDAPYVYG